MALSAFDDKSKKPGAKDLEEMLGRTRVHWNRLIAQLGSTYPPLDASWNFAGAKWGWSLRLKQKKRTVLYMTPCKAHFLVGVVLGGKAVKVARESDLPQPVLTLIDEAKRYAEGTGIRLPVKNKQDRDSVIKLAAIKMAN